MWNEIVELTIDHTFGSIVLLQGYIEHVLATDVAQVREFDDLLILVVHCYDLQALLLDGITLDLFMLSHLIHKEIIDEMDQFHVTRKNF